MGTDQSKQAREATPPKPASRPATSVASFRAQEEEPERYQYGPPRPTRPQSSVPPASHNSFPTTTTSQRTSMPPPYSSIDPRRVPCVANSNRTPNFPTSEATTTATPQNNCVMCGKTNGHSSNCQYQHSCHNLANDNQFPVVIPSQKSPPPIPPLPHQRQVNDPFKWSSQQNLSSHPVMQPIKVNTNLQSKKPPPKQTPSPNYDSTNNPYVWTSSQQQDKQPSPPASSLPIKKTFVIDLNKELSTLGQKSKGNPLPSFQHFHAQLKKNISVSDVRKTMVGDKYLSDVKFIVGGSTFHAHKMVLITASFYFYDHFHIKGESQLNVESVDPGTFQKIMNYCYTDKLEVTEDDVLELLLASNQLQIRQLTNVCHGFISKALSADSVFTIFEKALELNNEIFKKKCLDFINRNELTCFSSKGFFAMTLPSLLKVLDACQYPSEQVSEIVEKWTNGSMGIFQEPVNVQPPIQPVVAPPKAQPVGMPKSKGAVKKGVPGKKKKQPNQPKFNNIPPLMSLPTVRPNTGPPKIPPFPYPPPFMQHHMQPMPPSPMYNQVRPFAMPPRITPNNHPYNALPPRVEKLINDDDDNDSIIGKDDEAKIKINVRGPRQQLETEFSRLDFVCKRSMLIHEIWFSENLAPKCNDVRVTITVLEGDKRSDIHQRMIPNNKPGMKMNFLRFTRDPLKVFIGQKFFVKLNFNNAALRLNVAAEGLSANEMVALRKDPDVKKYFNCITSLVVTEMPTA